MTFLGKFLIGLAALVMLLAVAYQRGYSARGKVELAKDNQALVTAVEQKVAAEKRADKLQLQVDTNDAKRQQDLADYKLSHPDRPVRLCPSAPGRDSGRARVPEAATDSSGQVRADRPDVSQEPGRDIGPELFPEADRADRAATLLTWWQERALALQASKVCGP